MLTAISRVGVAMSAFLFFAYSQCERFKSSKSKLLIPHGPPPIRFRYSAKFCGLQQSGKKSCANSQPPRKRIIDSAVASSTEARKHCWIHTCTRPHTTATTRPVHFYLQCTSGCGPVQYDKSAPFAETLEMRVAPFLRAKCHVCDGCVRFGTGTIQSRTPRTDTSVKAFGD